MKWLLLAMYLTKMADCATTEMALGQGAVEHNPFMQSQMARWSYAAVAPLAVYEVGRHSGMSRRARIVTYIAASAVWGYAAIHNYQNYRQARGRAFQLRFAVSF